MPFSGKTLWRVFIIFLAAILLSLGGLAYRSQSMAKDLFRLNKALVEDDFYMADFEFKMMGIVYYLDKGRYWQALSTLYKFHTQLETREGLRKVPQFADAGEEAQFFLDLQNPVTGAFMDSAFPACTYNEPTENVVAHLAVLSRDSGEKLRLNHPLRYLEDLEAPGGLHAFLDDVSNIGWLGNRFPETTYVFARSLASALSDESAIRENGLYDFSPEYLGAMRDWFYRSQDPETGYWGPKSRRTGRLARLDLNNTASVIKVFVDSSGRDLHEQYPLRYREKLVETTLEIIDRPPPDGEDLDDWHDWNISTTKGIRMLLRYLWRDATPRQHERIRALLEKHIHLKFERFYAPQDGGFSLYPDAGEASLDGTASMILGNIGAFSPELQSELWGPPQATIQDLGRIETSTIEDADLAVIVDEPKVNSLRIYLAPPDFSDLLADANWVTYPRQTPIVDVAELVPKLLAWLDGNAPSMGNWTSKAQLLEDYSTIRVGHPGIVQLRDLPAALTDALKNSEGLTIIGFDQLQIPIYRLEIQNERSG